MAVAYFISFAPFLNNMEREKINDSVRMNVILIESTRWMCLICNNDSSKLCLNTNTVSIGAPNQME
jgi:hypothetical protein